MDRVEEPLRRWRSTTLPVTLGPRASMPTGRWRLRLVATSDGKLYAMGGSIATGVVEAYDIATDTWSARAALPTVLVEPGLAVGRDGKIYAIGGHILSGEAVASVEVYDTATDT